MNQLVANNSGQQLIWLTFNSTDLPSQMTKQLSCSCLYKTSILLFNVPCKTQIVLMVWILAGRFHPYITEKQAQQWKGNRCNLEESVKYVPLDKLNETNIYTTLHCTRNEYIKRFTETQIIRKKKKKAEVFKLRGKKNQAKRKLMVRWPK